MPVLPQHQSSVARSGRHPIALAGWLLLSGTVIGVGCALIAIVTPRTQTSLPAFAITALILMSLGRTLIYPLAGWFRFALEISDTHVVVYELQNAGVSEHHYPLATTVVSLERMPWDYLLGTGTVTLTWTGGERRFRLVTPVAWVYQLRARHQVGSGSCRSRVS